MMSSDSSLLKSLQEDFLKCMICLDQLKSPRMLPCQHVFCTKCILGIMQSRNIFNCPSCRFPVTVPENRLKGLPVAFHFNGLLDLVKHHQSGPVERYTLTDQVPGKHETCAARIAKKKEIYNECNETDVDQEDMTVLHEGVTCEGCCGEIKGPRYKCLTCQDANDFSVCHRCYKAGFHQEHVLLRLRMPVKDLKIYEINKDIVEEKGYHPHITCDGCGLYPVKGIRYKCVICRNFDLCVDCDGFRLHGEHAMAILHIGRRRLKIHCDTENKQNILYSLNC